RASDQVLGGGIRADAHSDAFAHCGSMVEALLLQIRFETSINCASHLLERQFAQGNEICGAKEVSERALGPVYWINITTAHPGLQSFRSKVHQNHFIHPLHNPIRDGFSDRNASNLLYQWRQTLDVLNVDG